MAQISDTGVKAIQPYQPIPTQRGAIPATSKGVSPTGGSQPAPTAAPEPQAGAVPWASDPILQQIQNLTTANNAAADASALAARQQALINFGYTPELASLYDSTSAGSAQANPYSVLAQLQHAHDLRQTNLNESYNKANLFYSGHRGQALGEEGRQYGAEQYGATQTLQGILKGIEDQRLGTHLTNQGQVTDATQGAYDRYLNQQLTYGLGDSGSGGSATPTAQRSALPAAGNRVAARRALLRRNY